MDIRKPVADKTIKLSKDNKIKLVTKEVKVGNTIRKIAYPKIDK